ncbi:MAG TPA: response regulator transcription factor [Nonomuraea sp.]|nr:response regulator transcription factor [Nonomuraea sp.]
MAFLIDQGVPADSIVVTRLTKPSVGTSKTAPANRKPVRRGRILLVEDDRAISDPLRRHLIRAGYDTTAEYDGASGLREAYAGRPDLILLDLGLPEMDGIEVLRRLRAVSDVPVIIVTARNDLNDRMLGLTAGADDYLVKPFHLVELLARIERVLHRRSLSVQWTEEIYDDGLIRLDSARREAHAAGSRLNLTPTEFRLLNLLVRHAGAVQPLDTILAHVWNDPSVTTTGRVKFTISRLRRKLDGTAAGSASIVSARGVGYLYRPPTKPAEAVAETTTSKAGYGHAAHVLSILNADDEKL